MSGTGKAKADKARMDRDDRFLKREYRKILLPVILSVLGGTINALIDSVFVSQKLGSDGLAAVNMSMPVYLILCTFGSLIAAGASVRSSQDAGADKLADAQRHYHAALTVSLVTGLLLTGIGLLICRPLSVLLAQNGELQHYVFEYSLITMIGALPTILSYLPLNYLQIEGKTKAITVTMLIMVGTDIFLDWLLLFVFELGMYGASLASLISCLAACLYGIFAMETGYSNYHIRLCRVRLSDLWGMVQYGSPAALGNFLDAVKLLSLNALILHFGGAETAAVWAVLNSVSELSIAVTSGVPRAALPMMGAYYTAHENSGLRILMRLQALYGLILSTLFSGVILLFHAPLRAVFDAPTSLLLPFAALSAYILLELLCSVWTNFFHASDRLLLSDILVVCRKLAFPVLSAVVLSVTSGYIWAFLPIGELLTLLTGMCLTQRIRRKQKGKEHALSGILLLDDYLEREKKVLDFSIVPNVEAICSASEQIKDFCAENNMNSRQTMRLELAIEELLTIISQKVPGLTSVDLRAFAFEENMGIRIRCAGKCYDPFDLDPDTDMEDEMMGVEMLKRMSSDVSFTYSFGMNIINIAFAAGQKADRSGQK